jgi:hypothetical protein
MLAGLGRERILAVPPRGFSGVKNFSQKCQILVDALVELPYLWM